MSDNETTPGPVLSEEDRGTLNIAIDEAETCECCGDEYGTAHVYAAVEAIVARHVAAERERREQVEQRLARAVVDLAEALDDVVRTGKLADRIATQRDEARAEVERLAERIKSCPRHPQWSGVVWDCVFCGEAVNELRDLRAGVAALADAIAAGTVDFMAGFEKAGEGLSTRMSGESAALVVQVREEMEAEVRALLSDPSAALGAVKAQAWDEGQAAIGTGGPFAPEPNPYREGGVSGGR